MNAIQAEIDRLDQLSVPDLVARYVEVYGKPPRAKNRRFLEKRIAFRVAEAATGGLSTTARARLDELMQAIEIDVPANGERTVTGSLHLRAKPGDLAIGGCVERAYKGEHLMLRREVQGFRVEGCTRVDAGTVFKSISAAAAACAEPVHGKPQHLNGRLFFGLSSRKQKP